MSIFVRSPYILTINEASQVATKVEIYLWNGSGSMPGSPAYTLSKLIPSSNNPATYYDISPYAREYINHTTLQNITTSNANTPTVQYCNVGIKKFKRITNTFVQVGSTTTVKAYDGYGYYEDGANVDLGRIHLTEGSYSYYLDGSNNTGHLTIENLVGDFIKYTNLSTGANITTSLGSANVRDFPLVYSTYLTDGNQVEIINSSVVVWTATFTPKDECKYTPVRCDFVNKYGAWQTTWFFKASNDSISVENTEYNLMPLTYPTYDVKEGQRKTFNTNGKKSIKVNTDWVGEAYSEVIKQLMLSERILLDSSPVKINTKSTELFKHINTKMINYQLEFDYTFDLLNSVV